MEKASRYILLILLSLTLLFLLVPVIASAAGEDNVTGEQEYMVDLPLEEIPIVDGVDGASETDSDPESATATDVGVIPGDVTGDGKVNLTDLVRLRKYLAGMDVIIEADAGDVTGDGTVGLADLVRLRKYLAGMDVVLL